MIERVTGVPDASYDFKPPTTRVPFGATAMLLVLWDIDVPDGFAQLQGAMLGDLL